MGKHMAEKLSEVVYWPPTTDITALIVVDTYTRGDERWAESETHNAPYRLTTSKGLDVFRTHPYPNQSGEVLEVCVKGCIIANGIALYINNWNWNEGDQIWV